MMTNSYATLGIKPTPRARRARRAWGPDEEVPQSSWAPQEASGATLGSIGEPVEKAAFERIVSELSMEPIEDGVTHVAETLLERLILQDGGRSLNVYLAATMKSKWAADFVRLLGRVVVVDAKLRQQILTLALKSEDIDMRDAGMQAAENWRDRRLAQILRNHHDPVSWLAEYAADVIEGLES